MNPPNIDEQLDAARALIETVRKGAAGSVGPHPLDPHAQAFQNAFRRLAYVQMSALSEADQLTFAGCMITALGEEVGLLLRALPDAVVQTLLDVHAREILSGIGADPTRSGVDVTISSGEDTFH